MSSNRSVRAGDPFAYAGSRRDEQEQDHPHGCIDGWVYLGFEGEDRDGELVEEIERVPCRRCEDEHQRWLAEADRINEQEMWGPRGRPGR